MGHGKVVSTSGEDGHGVELQEAQRVGEASRPGDVAHALAKEWVGGVVDPSTLDVDATSGRHDVLDGALSVPSLVL
jgi:hypothetical protein